MKLLLTPCSGPSAASGAGFAGSASQAAQNDVYAFGVASQNPGCTEDGPPVYSVHVHVQSACRPARRRPCLGRGVAIQTRNRRPAPDTSRA